MKTAAAWLVSLTLSLNILGQTTNSPRPRARDIGLKIGILSPGPLNSITDVAGVSVGHSTIIKGDHIRTGVTAILPHGGNLFKEKVPAAIYVGNGRVAVISSDDGVNIVLAVFDERLVP